MDERLIVLHCISIGDIRIGWYLRPEASFKRLMQTESN
ncbi:hypothetical protein AM1_3260 [Acaryochloris marina MBIC11017]|uniref:Uncharacterized protein n=1 Tax=Acaryochloris marina (strain MBIC 11017) TaxID=329726 RepID=B0CFV2_ACAM1|nr:hypothetical protein AM1_3260 [Acaryochloris marina MBIC11017]